MSSSQRLNLSGRTDAPVNSGLFSDYESIRTRTSNRSSDFTSPLRTNSRYSDFDENLMTRSVASPSMNSMLSPIRSLMGTPNRSSPSSYSRKYNAVSKFSLIGDSLSRKSSSDVYKTKSSLFSSVMAGSPGSRMTVTANEMGVHQFPWVSPSAPIIPLIQSPVRNASSPSLLNNSPLPDSSSTSPRRSRIKIRLAGPNRSIDNSLNMSSLDMSSNIEEPSTTKSVIQVLKEMSRKRPYIPIEEDEEHRQEAKRRVPEHNLFISCLDEEENPPIPARNTSEEDRKRTKDPDWKSPLSHAGSKRRRKNNYSISNEILSSLSSSIGLLPLHYNSVTEKQKQTISVGTQVTLLKDSSEKKKSEREAQTNAEKFPKEFKEASTMPDPPIPQPRPRSPVKENVVTNANVILKSALSKFNIQPNENSKKTDDLSAPISFGTSTENTKISSTVSISCNIQNTVSSVITTDPIVSLGSTGASGFSLPSTITSRAVFGSSPKLTETNMSNGKTVTNEQAHKERNEASRNEVRPEPEVSGFQFASLKNSTSSAQISGSTQPGTSAFSRKLPETSVNSAPASIAAPKFGNTSVTPASSALNVLDAMNTTPVTSPKTPTTTVLQAPLSAASMSTASQPGSSVFTLQSKITVNNTVMPTGTSKDSSSGLFSFGKVENKATSLEKEKEKEAVNKSFQFGSSGQGFSFGQSTDNKKENIISPFGTTTTTTTSTAVTSSEPPFSFGGTVQKDDKSGGFSFKTPTISNTSGDIKAPFSFAGSTTNNPTTSTNTIVGTSTITTSIFPTTLFNSSTGSASSVTTAAPLPTTGTINNPFGSLKTSLGNTSTHANTPFGSTTTSTSVPTLSSTTSTPLFGNRNPSTTTADLNSTNPPSLFGSGSNDNQTMPTTTIFGTGLGSTANTFPSLGATSTPSFSNNGTTVAKPAVFGNTTTTPVTGTSNTFGSTTSSASVFGSTGSSLPTFGSTTSTASTPTFGSGLGNNTTAAFGGQTTVTQGPSTFGSTSSSAPLFGNTTSAAAGSTFSTNATAPPAFGTPAPSSTTVAPAFGGSGSSGFGSSTPTFGGASNSTPAFGAQSQTVPAFGSSTPAFGAQSSFGTQNTTPSFGSSSGFGSSSTTAFGSAAVASTAPAFGSSTTGGGTTVFGSTAPATGTTAFGSTTPVAGTNAFGSTTSQGSAPTFGSTASQGSTPAFGSTTPALAAPSFSSTTSGAAAPAFGTSTPTIASPAFGSSASTPAAPSFGSATPAFGSTTFGSQDANKPFSFNAPNPPTPQAGSFTFTGAQQSQSSGNMFQFGSTVSSPQPTQPFQFNASQPTAQGFTAGFSPGVGGQQMFSIGSGSTAPRRVTARRKK